MATDQPVMAVRIVDSTNTVLETLGGAASPLTLTEGVGESALTLTGATQTSSFPVLTMTQTWNNVATTFTGVKLDVTNTTSATASKLIDLQAGGVSQFSVKATGTATFATGTWDVPSIVLSGNTAGFFARFTDRITIGGGNGGYHEFIEFDCSSNSAMTIGATGMVAWTTDTAASATDTSIARAAAGVFTFGTGLGGSPAAAFFQWGGQKRVAADVTATSTTTLANITGLSVNVAAGRTYSFEAYLSFTDAAAGGIKAAIAGTATATDIRYDGYIVDSAANGIKGNAQANALAGEVASATTTGTAGCVIIKGTITVNVAGTLTVQHAQNTSNGTATTIKRGSYFIVHDMP